MNCLLPQRTAQVETNNRVRSERLYEIFHAASSALFKTIEVAQNDCLTYAG